MNDFTKEELQIIHLDMTTYVNNAKPLKESPGHKELRGKIGLMIDKYCEHGDTYHCDYCGIISCEDCKQPCGGELMDE